MKPIHFNLPQVLCDHLIGENHPTHHRMFCGMIIMVIGVCVARFGGHYIHIEVIAIFADLTGYGIHALGATPFIEVVLKAMKD